MNDDTGQQTSGMKPPKLRRKAVAQILEMQSEVSCKIWGNIPSMSRKGTPDLKKKSKTSWYTIPFLWAFRAAYRKFLRSSSLLQRCLTILQLVTMGCEINCLYFLECFHMPVKLTGTEKVAPLSYSALDFQHVVIDIDDTCNPVHTMLFNDQNVVKRIGNLLASQRVRCAPSLGVTIDDFVCSVS